MLSLFGERSESSRRASLTFPDVPTTSGNDPVKTAQQAAEVVKANGFDGVDVNYEGEMNYIVGSALWLTLDGQITTQVGIDWVIGTSIHKF